MTTRRNRPGRALSCPGPVRLRGRDDGSASLELAVLAPMLLLVLALAIAGARVALAGGAVESAARDAARQASISRTPAAARSAAAASAQTTLAAEGLRCASLTVEVDTSGLTRPVGQPGEVRAEVTCVVDLSDLTLGLPGSKTMRASFVSPVDPYRGRR